MVNSVTSTERSHGTGGSRICDPFPAQSPYLSQPTGTGAETPKGNDTAAMGRPFRGYLPQQGDLPYLPNACQRMRVLRRCGSQKNENGHYDAFLMERIASRSIPDSGFARCKRAAWLPLAWICCGMTAGLEAY